MSIQNGIKTYSISRSDFILVHRLHLHSLPKRLVHATIEHSKRAIERCQYVERIYMIYTDLSIDQSEKPKASVSPIASGKISRQRALMAKRRFCVGSPAPIWLIKPTEKRSTRALSAVVSKYYEIHAIRMCRWAKIATNQFIQPTDNLRILRR